MLAGDARIADGNSHETLDVRLERADTVVVLDMHWWRCSARAFLRGFRMPGELPKVATTRPGPGSAMSGVWPRGSGGSATQNRQCAAVRLAAVAVSRHSWLCRADLDFPTRKPYGTFPLGN